MLMQITFPWDESQKGNILSSFFWLYMVFAIPFGQSAQKFGSKLILGLSMGLASVFTLLIPVAGILVPRYAFQTILSLRILNGVAQVNFSVCYFSVKVFWLYIYIIIHDHHFQSAIFPTTNVLVSRWVTPSERGGSLALCFSGNSFHVE